MAAGKWETDINEVLLEFGVTKEPFQENAAEELATTLQDYHDLSDQYSDMLIKYGYEKRPVRKNGVWLCPECGRRIQYNHSYCHFCGKRIGWRGPEKNKGYTQCLNPDATEEQMAEWDKMIKDLEKREEEKQWQRKQQ